VFLPPGMCVVMRSVASLCNTRDVTFEILHLESSFLYASTSSESSDHFCLSRSSGQGQGHRAKHICVSCLRVVCLRVEDDLVWSFFRLEMAYSGALLMRNARSTTCKLTKFAWYSSHVMHYRPWLYQCTYNQSSELDVYISLKHDVCFSDYL